MEDQLRRKMIEAQSRHLMEKLGDDGDPRFGEGSTDMNWKQTDDTGDAEDEELGLLKREMRNRRKFIKDQVELSRQLDVQQLNSGDKIRCADSFLSFIIFGTGVACIGLAMIHWKSDWNQ